MCLTFCLNIHQIKYSVMLHESVHQFRVADCYYDMCMCTQCNEEVDCCWSITDSWCNKNASQQVQWQRNKDIVWYKNYFRWRPLWIRSGSPKNINIPTHVTGSYKWIYLWYLVLSFLICDAISHAVQNIMHTFAIAAEIKC